MIHDRILQALVMAEAFIAIFSFRSLCLVKPEKSEKPCSRKVGKLLIQPLRVAKDTIDLVSAAPAGNYKCAGCSHDEQ